MWERHGGDAGTVAAAAVERELGAELLPPRVVRPATCAGGAHAAARCAALRHAHAEVDVAVIPLLVRRSGQASGRGGGGGGASAASTAGSSVGAQLPAQQDLSADGGPCAVGLAEYLSELTSEGCGEVEAAMQGDHGALASESARELRVAAARAVAMRGGAVEECARPRQSDDGDGVVGAIRSALPRFYPRAEALTAASLSEAVATAARQGNISPESGAGALHANLSAPVAVLVGECAAYALFATGLSAVACAGASTLETALRFGRGALRREGGLVIQLLAYQLLSALAPLHAAGGAHGDVRASNVGLSPHLWLQLDCLDRAHGRCAADGPDSDGSESDDEDGSDGGRDPRALDGTGKGTSAKPTRLRRLLRSACESAPSCSRSAFARAMSAWRQGEMSNLDYLLLLNSLAGRRTGDEAFLPVLPWVIDFTQPPEASAHDTRAPTGDDGWRDLTRSKWRLSKGEQQLDFTYANSEPPHHISDEALSELTACIYTARRQPLSRLQSVVRANYEPNEYPASIARLYAWSPDEAIAAFYDDPTVFDSVHANMPNLAVPDWAASPADFIARHRAALESPRASAWLHHWIDLTFGYKLTGAAAVDAKNVALDEAITGASTGGAATLQRARGRYQLFRAPHPPRGAPTRPEAPLRLRSPGVAGMGDVAVTLSGGAAAHAHGGTGAGTGGGARTSVAEPIFVAVPPGGAGALVATLVDAEQEHAFVDACDFSWDLAPNELDNAGAMKADVMRPDGTQNGAAVGAHDRASEHAGGDGGSDAGLDGIAASATDAAGDLMRVGRLLRHMLRACGFGEGVRAREVVRSLTQASPKMRPSAVEVLASSYFTPAVRRAHGVLLALRSRHAGSSLLRVASLLRAAPADTATLVAPACMHATLTHATSDGGSAGGAVEIIQELIRLLPGKGVQELILPALLDLLTGHTNKLLGARARTRALFAGGSGRSGSVDDDESDGTGEADDSSEQAGAMAAMRGLHALRHALVQAGVVRALGAKLGTDEYVARVHPALLGALERTSAEVAGAAAAALSAGCCVPMAAPMLLQQTVFPLLSSAARVGDLSDAAAAVLSHACVELGEELVGRHVLPNAVAVACALPPSIQGNPRSHRYRAIVNALRVVLAAAPPSSSVRALSPLPRKIAGELAVGSPGFVGSPPDPSFLRSPSAERGLWIWLPGPDEGALPASPAGASASAKRLAGDGMGQADSASLGGSVGAGNDSPALGAGSASDAASEASASGKHWGMSEGLTTTRGLGGGVGFSDEGGRSGPGSAWTLRARCLLSFRAHGTVLRAAQALESEGLVLTAGGSTRNGPRVRLWELSTGACVREYTTSSREPITAVAALGTASGPGGAVVGCDGGVHVWRTASGERAHTFNDASAVEVCSGWAPSGATAGNSSAAVRFTAFACLSERVGETTVVAGTSDGAVIELDAHACARVSRAACMPGGEGLAAAHWAESARAGADASALMSGMSAAGAGAPAAPAAVTSIAQLGYLGCGRGSLAVGLANGAAAVVERGAGRLRVWFKAHDGAITKLLPYREHYLVSAGADKAVALWDLRKASSSGAAGAMLVHTLTGLSSAVTDCAIVDSTVACASGSRLGVAPLGTAPPRGATMALEPIRLRGVKGKQESAGIVALGIMRHSKLFLAGADDGALHVCV